MMIKKISFGSDEGLLLTDFNIKKKVVDYLYNSLNLSKHRFIMLNTINKLEFLKETVHYVSPSFKGFNYFLIFMNIDNRKYCVAVDRRKLSYHEGQLDLKTCFIVKVNVKTSDSIFDGSIFDGKLIESSNKYIFLIQDCFHLMGKKIIDLEMEEKMNYLDNILKIHFTNSEVCSNFSFKINKLWTYKDLNNLIKNIIPTCSIPCNGLVFYPKYSGIFIIHIEKKNDKIEIETSQNQNIEAKTYDIIYNFVDFLKSRTYSYEKGNKFRKLWVSKSNIPDVYNLSEKENGERIDIAHIPNIKISHLCKDTIKEDKPIKFNCVYHTKFKKWIPIAIETN
jgi:hypothetical protein